MQAESSNAFFQKIACARGNVIATPCRFSPSQWKNGNLIFITPENLSLEKTVFENLSMPLAMEGTPWEIARKRIFAELRFWFGEKDAETFSPVRANELSLEERSRLLLACACAANLHAHAVAVSESVSLSDKLFKMLKSRAEHDAFSLVLENPPADYFLQADEIFISGAGIPNLFIGKILGTGAGEFFAETPSGTQIHGKLCGTLPEEIPEGADVNIFLPPEILRIDAFPPEENFFELGEGGEIFFDGHLHFREFKLRGNAAVLRAAATQRQSLETADTGTPYAWFFPEDALGFFNW